MSGETGGELRPAGAKMNQPGRSHPVVGWAACQMLALCARLPLPLVHGVGGAIGSLVGWLPSRARDRSLTNLELCLPELSPKEHKRIARRALASMARMVLEVGPLWYWKPERILSLARRIHGQEHLDAALARGQGLILAMPHLGSWEYAGLWVSARKPTTGLFRHSRVREMDAVLCDGRKNLGATLVPAGAFAVRTLRRALGRGEVVVMLPDTDPKYGQSTFAPFFGVQANTSTLLSRLAHDSGATVLFSYAERLARGRGYDVHFVPTHPAVSSDDLALATRELNRGLETIIRRLPEQYMWRYRRFKRRPDGEPSPYRKSYRRG